MVVANYKKFDMMRYGTPWLARLVLEQGKLKYRFVSSAFKGTFETGGTLECDLEEGDCFAFGQKDYLCQHTTVWIGQFIEGKMIELSNQEVERRLREQENKNGKTVNE